VELKNVQDGSALRSLFAMRLKPNSFAGFTQTLEKKIISPFRKQKVNAIQGREVQAGERREGECGKQNYLTNLSLLNRKSRESLDGVGGPDG
jgi:hypothetical protein